MQDGLGAHHQRLGHHLGIVGCIDRITQQRKLKAAQTWCERINALPAEHRQELPWHYVLLGEASFDDWQGKGANLSELLNFARVRPVASAALQGALL